MKDVELTITMKGATCNLVVDKNQSVKDIFLMLNQGEKALRQSVLFYLERHGINPTEYNVGKTLEGLTMGNLNPEGDLNF